MPILSCKNIAPMYIALSDLNFGPRLRNGCALGRQATAADMTAGTGAMPTAAYMPTKAPDKPQDRLCGFAGSLILEVLPLGIDVRE